METCAICKKPVAADETVWLHELVAFQTHSSPSEYESMPMHLTCLEHLQERDEDYERAAERARGNDFEDTDGKDWT